MQTAEKLSARKKIVKAMWDTHGLLVTCSVISIVLLVVFFALQMRGSPILSLNLQWILVAGVPLVVALVAGGYVKRLKLPGDLEIDLQQKLTQQNVESAVEDERFSGQDVKQIPGEFEKIKPYVDWQKFYAAVVAWASQKKARNAWDMGPKNYLRCLYDLGIPGGKRFELIFEQDGSLKYQ
jgi:hypothetical protein